MPVRRIDGAMFNDEPLHETWYSPVSQLHSSGHPIATLAGSITNHNQNTAVDVANSSDTNSTTSVDGMAGCCNLHRQELMLIVTVLLYIFVQCVSVVFLIE
jgi:hypothetical protein